MARRNKVKLVLLTSPLILVTSLLLVIYSCHETGSLPPVKGPPLKIPGGTGAKQAMEPRPLQVVYASPAGQVAIPHLQVVASFNKPMVDLARVEQRAEKSPLVMEPAVSGKQRWLGSRSLTFRPDKPLPGSTAFAVKVPGSVRAADGSILGKDHTWTFTTPLLTVSRVVPRSMQHWIRPDAKVELFFNQPVNPAVVQKHASFIVAPRGGAPLAIAAVVRRGRGAKHVVLHPATTFPKDAKITVKLGKGMTGREGPLPMGKDFTSSFRTFGPFKLVGLSCKKDCDPDGSIRVMFSNPVKISQARKAIRINNRRVKAGRSTYRSTSVYLGMGLSARRRYVVKVDRNLRDQFGQQLASHGPLSFNTTDHDPYVSLPMETGVLEAAGPKKLPIYFRNADSARLLSRRLSRADLASLLGNGDFWSREKLLLAGHANTRTQALKVSIRPNRRVTKRVDLGKLIGGGGRGILALELSTKLRYRRDTPERRVHRVVVRITDLAITAKYSPHTSVFWVTSLSTGRPVAGADVAIWRRGGAAPLWSGKTDAGGLAVAPGASKLGAASEARKFIFFARKDRDESYVVSSTQSGISPWDFGIDGTWEDSTSSLRGMVFSDRGIYRPGDTVRIKGILRRSGTGGLVTPLDRSVKLAVTDSRGEEVIKIDRKLSEFGSFDHRLELPQGAPLGSYSVRCKPEAGGVVLSNFEVEEYRPAEFKVAVRTGRRQYVRGDSMEWTAAGAYLFGAPMRKSKTRWYINWRSSGFQPPDHEGFVFSDEVRWWESVGASRSSSGALAQGSGRLDHSGELSSRVALKPPLMSTPRSYEVEASVTDVSRQTISSRRRVLLHPGEFYIGARPRETFVKAGDRVEADVVAVTPAGKRTPGRKISGTLFRRTWHSVRKKGMGGSQFFVTRPRDTPVGTCAVTSATRVKRCNVTPAKAGYHYLRLQSKDARGNPLSSTFGIYVSGPDYVPWRRDNESRLELVTDRKQYKVGQVARVLIKSPFAGAHGLFTVERNGIVTRKPFKLSRTSAWMEVPITKELIPNAYVSAILVRGRVKAPRGKGEEEDPGKPAFKVGYAKLSVSQAPKKLQVSVKPLKKEYRPGQEATVDLVVRDARGKGTRAELTVFVADEGVLSLIGYKTPDPMSIFYAERGLSVRTADNRIVLISRRIFGQKGNNPGGGGGGMGQSGPGGVRRNFVTTPYFNPAVITDDQGKARITFDLPDNLTTFRVMAVAVTRDSRFGHADNQIKVNKPLLLLPTLPRLVRVGDRIEAGVVVHNRANKDGQVTVKVQATGIDLTGPATRTLSITDGGSAEARFAFQARSPGEATFRFDARLEDFKDALELKRPVKLPVVVESVATFGSTDSGVAEGIVPSSGVRDDTGGLEVTLSSSALVGLKTGVQYLLDYPYECLEQSTSRLVPLVMLQDLTRAFDLRSSGEADVLAKKLISKIEKLQRWDGGFSYWASSHRAYPWASAYAAWGLSRARKSGLPVSEKVLKKAKRYIKGQLRAKPGKGKDDEALLLNTKAFLTHVLVELGDRPSGYISTLYERRAELAAFGKALLLSALARSGGDKKMIENVTAELTNQIHQTAKVAKVEENLGDGYAPLFHSSLRSTAMALEALLHARPGHPLVDKLVSYLLAARKEGRWGNTQENAYALTALQSFYKIREKETPRFMARVALGQNVLMEKSFEGRSLEAHRGGVPMKKLARFKGALGFTKSGKGRLYYSARLTYARSALPDKPWDEGFFVTRSYERVPQDVTSFSAMRGAPDRPPKGVAEVKAGDLVRVTLRVVVPQQMHFVAVDDPLPAGLEAVNFKLMTAARSLRRHAFSSHRSRHARSRASWYTPFYHREIRDDRVLLFADAVPPGIHTYVYLARATTIGTFVAAPTKVEQMYQPEVFGRTGASSFKVLAR